MAAGEYPLLLELILPPWRRYQLISHSTPDEVIAALRDATEERRSFRMPFSDARDFEGVVDDDRFAVSRIIGYRNSIRPLILGRVEAAPGGTRVSIVMRPDWMALVSIVLILAVAMTITVLVEMSVGAVRGHPGLALVTAVIAGSYLMISAPFGLEARWAGAMLRRLLRVEEIARAPEERLAAGGYGRGCGVPFYARAPYTLEQMRRQARIRRAYIVYFVLVWFIGMGAYVSFSIAYGSGATSPTVTQTAAMTNHGRTVYVTPHQKFIADTLRRLMLGGIISVMVGALIIDRMLGVPLFSNSPRH